MARRIIPTKDQVKPQSAYGLEGALDGQDLFIVAPGPTSADHDLPALKGRNVLALNSAIEITPFTWWMYSDRSFTKIYMDNMKGIVKPPVERVILCSHQVRRVQEIFKGKEIWDFDYQMRLQRWEKGWEGKPFWYSPKRRYIPGRCSVFNVALSVATLMRPSRVILVGVDFRQRGIRSYYHPAVKQNHGPWNRQRALGSGLKWFRIHLEWGTVWPNLNLVTTSSYLAREVPVELVRWQDIV